MDVNFDFTPLPGGEELISVPAQVLANMPTDARSCYLLVKAVRNGELTPELTNMECVTWPLQVDDHRTATGVHVDPTARSDRSGTQDAGDAGHLLHPGSGVDVRKFLVRPWPGVRHLKGAAPV